MDNHSLPGISLVEHVAFEQWTAMSIELEFIRVIGDAARALVSLFEGQVTMKMIASPRAAILPALSEIATQLKDNLLTREGMSLVKFATAMAELCEEALKDGVSSYESRRWVEFVMTTHRSYTGAEYRWLMNREECIWLVHSGSEVCIHMPTDAWAWLAIDVLGLWGEILGNNLKEIIEIGKWALASPINKARAWAEFERGSQRVRKEDSAQMRERQDMSKDLIRVAWGILACLKHGRDEPAQVVI